MSQSIWVLRSKGFNTISPSLRMYSITKVLPRKAAGCSARSPKTIGTKSNAPPWEGRSLLRPPSGRGPLTRRTGTTRILRVAAARGSQPLRHRRPPSGRGLRTRRHMESRHLGGATGTRTIAEHSAHLCTEFGEGGRSVICVILALPISFPQIERFGTRVCQISAGLISGQ